MVNLSGKKQPQDVRRESKRFALGLIASQLRQVTEKGSLD